MLTYKTPALADTIFKPDTTTGHQTENDQMNAIDTAYKAGMDHAARIESDGRPLHPVLGDSLAYMYGELIIPRNSAFWLGYNDFVRGAAK